MKEKTPVFSMFAVFAIAFCGAQAPQAQAQTHADWLQWARTPQHTGASPAVGQSPNRKLADITYDPFTNQEKAEESGELLAHYQAPLIHGKKVFLETKTGTYNSCQPPGSGQPFPCGPDDWQTQIWNERAFVWQNGKLVQLWNFESDWKPEPNAGGLGGWEPVFHAAVGNGFVFVPGFAGSIYQVHESDGSLVAQYKPFGPTDDPDKYVSGPLTVDAKGNVYYNVLALNSANPWGFDVRNAWLVKVNHLGGMKKISYKKLVPGAPFTCGSVPCGTQRPVVNLAPAVSGDGRTVYTVSRPHFASDYAYLVAVNSDLTPQWQASLRDQIAPGVNGYAYDLSSSSPVVVPDGVLYGALGENGRGYLFKFNPSGQYLTFYDFGWDETPAVYAHDGTYSVILKDNFYGGGPYYITQLSASLTLQWHYQSPTNREWCVNAPAVDANGVVYANSEDGNIYVINQGGTLKGKIFLRQAVGAAYTPVALGRDGRIYTENDGDMFVVGN
jgi:hypothetical protein